LDARYHAVLFSPSSVTFYDPILVYARTPIFQTSAPKAKNKVMSLRAWTVVDVRRKIDPDVRR
jgi:hypothetical protein